MDYAGMTKTQIELLDSKEFWRRRYEEQCEYIDELYRRYFSWSGRRDMLLNSAHEMMDVIKERLADL